MSHPEVDLMVAMERRKDDLRAAEQSRLIHLATARHEDFQESTVRPVFSWSRAIHPLVLLTGRLLYAIGLLISSWGCRLQVRYANLGGNQAAPCD